MVRCAFRAAIFGATFFNNYKLSDEGNKSTRLSDIGL